MITTKSEIVTQSHGIDKEQYFRISDTNIAHILNILRNQMYTNKVQAVVREYMTNAYDAHCLSGCPDRPFSVQLPTGLYPFFTVRDYGPGLSEEQVFTLFTSYGDSTKRESNAYTGMLGIGSKAAFCYIDSFTVVSYQQGTAKTYSCYIDETEVGKVALMDEQATEEVDGLQINVSVKAADFYEFQRQTKYCAQFFAVLPEVDGVRAEPMQQFGNGVLDLSAEGIHFIYRTGGTTSAGVLMGNVLYPVTPEECRTFPWSEVHHGVNQRPFIMVMRVPVGYVDIAASREGLSYTSKTRKALAELFEDVKNKIGAKLDELVDACETPYQSAALFRTNEEIKVAHILSNNRSVKGTATSIVVNRFEQSFNYVNAAGKDYTRENFSLVSLYNNKLRFHDYRSPNGLPFVHQVVVNDVGVSNYKVRLNYLLSGDDYQQHGRKCLYVPTSQNLPLLIKVFGKAHIKLMSDINPPKEVLAQAVYKPRFDRKQSVFEFAPDTKNKWVEYDIEDVTKGSYVYVPIHRFQVADPLLTHTLPGNKFVSTFKVDITHMRLMLYTIGSLGLPVPKIVGVRKSVADSFKDLPNWIPWVDYMRSVITDQIKNPDSVYLANQILAHPQKSFDVGEHLFTYVTEPEIHPLLKYHERLWKKARPGKVDHYTSLFYWHESFVAAAETRRKEIDEVHKCRELVSLWTEGIPSRGNGRDNFTSSDAQTLLNKYLFLKYPVQQQTQSQPASPPQVSAVPVPVVSISP